MHILHRLVDRLCRNDGVSEEEEEKRCLLDGGLFNLLLDGAALRLAYLLRGDARQSQRSAQGGADVAELIITAALHKDALANNAVLLRLFAQLVELVATERLCLPDEELERMAKVLYAQVCNGPAVWPDEACPVARHPDRTAFYRATASCKAPRVSAVLCRRSERVIHSTLGGHVGGNAQPDVQ